MPAQTCARCHAPRTGAFRYCRECGYDFDADSMDAAGAAARAKSKAKAEAAARDAKKRGVAVGDGRRRRYVVRGLIAFEVAALVVLAGYGILTNVSGGPDIAAIFAAPRPTTPATPTPAVRLPATGFVPTGPTTEATVERVIDGDTIVVDAGGARLYVHYLGIDAPEAVALDRPVQFMGPEASQANAQLVSGQTVILERDVSEADDAARLLRDVWVDRDGTLFLVGLELVKAGFARAVPQPPDVKYQALYADAEAQAKAAGLGVWGVPPSADPEASAGPDGPTPSLRTFTSLEPVQVSTVRSLFRGGAGIYDWPSVTFPTTKVTMVWDVSSTTMSGCRLDWTIQAGDGQPVTGALTIDGRSRERGSGAVSVPADQSGLTVTSTCGDWLISLREAA